MGRLEPRFAHETSAADITEICGDAAGTVAQRACLDVSQPVILLSGRENTLAVARNLGRLGVPIYISGRAGCFAMHSRYCRKAFPVRRGLSAAREWRRLLLENPQPELLGSIVLAMCDESLEFIAANSVELQSSYRLISFDRDMRRAMLDKYETLVLAQKVGVPTPRFWDIETVEDVIALRGELNFPLMVKPRDSRAFMEDFGRKLFIVEERFEDVLEKVSLSHAQGHRVMLVEMIPGPDTLLSSFNTLRTPEGARLYNYTKCVIRRWPVNRGGGTFHQSVWLPETADLGIKLFDGLDWRGIGNVEFKRDLRDGQLKIIEVNGRFTAAQRLITEAGVPIDLILYCHLTRQALPTAQGYSQTMRLWYPMRDFLAFLQLRRAGQLTLAQWLRSIAGNSLLLPTLSWRDPWPSIVQALSGLRTFAGSPARYLGKALVSRS